MHWTYIALPIVSYGLGGISAGYWLVRLRTGRDVREQGSGSTGATNAARMLGRGGFGLTLALDAAKGAAVGATARLLGLPPEWSFASALLVVAGHVWPVQLRFRGGKGIAPLLGGWLALAPLALAPCAALALAALVLSRRFVLSGLCGLLLLPPGTWWVTRSTAAAALAAATLGVVLYAHRENLRTRGGPRSEIVK